MGSVTGKYELVQLASGVHSVRSREVGETFHPVIGPAAEAQALYVEQLALPRRIAAAAGEFVLWDIGLGAAANPLTLLNAVPPGSHFIRIVSFDRTLEPLIFALEHSRELPFLRGWEERLRRLLKEQSIQFELPGGAKVHWETKVGDFPKWLLLPASREWPKPHAIFFDAYSPATNPEMWTVDVFRGIYQLLDPARPCSMPTYSRSTMLRVTLLVAGFFVGRGHATGEKEETTIAANTLEFIKEPLGCAWLERARRSTSAEPLREGKYRQAPLTDDTWTLLRAHAQFSRH